MMPKFPAATTSGAAAGTSFPAAEKPPATFTDRLRTLTPVILTVVATVLAGISSSEMSLAQYQRSLAAQNQARAGDQWAFFQAKRIRHTVIERAIDFASAPPAPITVQTLQGSFEALATCLNSLGQDASGVAQSVGSATSEPERQQLLDSANSLAATAHQAAAQCRTTLEQSLKPLAARYDMSQAIAQLATERMPGQPGPLWEDKDIDAAISALARHASEEELRPLLAPLPDARIDGALRVAQAKIDALDRAIQPLESALRQLDNIMRQARAAAGTCQGAAVEVAAAFEDIPPSARSKSLTQANTGLAHRVRILRREAQRLAAYQVSRDDFTGRREDREARLNQQLAGLYDLRVELSGAASERHRRRSKQFFYGMLCAQAGVAVSSISLAARHPGGLWSLAGLAGLAAILFSTYVYLYV